MTTPTWPLPSDASALERELARVPLAELLRRLREDERETVAPPGRQS